jgi:hypothetical protein
MLRKYLVKNDGRGGALLLAVWQLGRTIEELRCLKDPRVIASDQTL